ncbi:MAG: DNA methylase [Chloroflexota bacterium]|nr:DNA methylase [Chloroflexota bacterium]
MHEQPADWPLPPLTPDADLDISRWREYADIITDSLWLLGARDRSGPHSAEYHGNFVPQIPNQIVRRFTTRGETVLDLFSGLGTTLIECRRLGRHSLGVELNPVVAARSRDLAVEADYSYTVRAEVLAGDSSSAETAQEVRELLGRHGDGYADCVLLHPPYHDIIRFSADPRDLSNSPSHQAFLEAFRRVVRHTRGLLRPGRHLALVIGDRYAGGEWVPLGFECMQVCREEGLVLKAINVKDMQGNERGKGKNTNLWRYRALKSGTYIFKHEYVMVFNNVG